MGAGHVRFFYSRTGYLAERQAVIITECLDRGFKISHQESPLPVEGLSDSWTPSIEDILVNLERLRSKLIEKPHFYRYRGEVVKGDFYDKIPLHKMF